MRRDVLARYVAAYRSRGNDAAITDLELETGGRVRASTYRQLVVGQRVTMGVRPEKIRISEVGGEGNSFPGEVSEVIFQGALCQFKVRLEGGPEVDIYRQASEGDGAYLKWAPGQKVWISWSEKPLSCSSSIHRMRVSAASS